MHYIYNIHNICDTVCKYDKIIICQTDFCRRSGEFPDYPLRKTIFFPSGEFDFALILVEMFHELFSYLTVDISHKAKRRGRGIGQIFVEWQS